MEFQFCFVCGPSNSEDNYFANLSCSIKVIEVSLVGSLIFLALCGCLSYSQMELLSLLAVEVTIYIYTRLSHTHTMRVQKQLSKKSCSLETVMVKKVG